MIVQKGDKCMKTADSLKELIQENGLSADALSKRLGVSGSIVARWIRENKPIKLFNLLKIAEYLKTKGIKTRLNTNGLGNLINGFDIAPKLAELIDEVSISLNASNEQDYFNICKPVFGLKSFNEILDFTKKCVGVGIMTTLTAVDIISEEEIEKCEKLAKKLGAEFRLRGCIRNNIEYI